VNRLGSATHTLSAGLDADRQRFVETLGGACVKTGWQVHAYVLMPNHFHLVVETPQPNLVAGMKWLKWFLGTESDGDFE
jgi:REP-associated tyrosine transposase